MKHARIAAVLALASIELKSPLFGNEKFVELKESQLDKIEAALVAAEAAANNTYCRKRSPRSASNHSYCRNREPQNRTQQSPCALIASQ